MRSNYKDALSPHALRCARTAIDHAPVDELAKGFLALGNPIRLAILLAVSGRELCVVDLGRLFKVTQGAVSQHLRRLREQGLVTTRRSRQNVYYRLDEEHARGLLREGLRRLAEAQTVVPAGEPATDLGGPKG